MTTPRYCDDAPVSFTPTQHDAARAAAHERQRKAAMEEAQ